MWLSPSRSALDDGLPVCIIAIYGTPPQQSTFSVHRCTCCYVGGSDGIGAANPISLVRRCAPYRRQDIPCQTARVQELTGLLSCLLRLSADVRRVSATPEQYSFEVQYRDLTPEQCCQSNPWQTFSQLSNCVGGDGRQRQELDLVLTANDEPCRP